MKVLMIGGTAFIGKAIVQCSLVAGHEVVLFNRGKSVPEPDFPLIKGDVNELLEYKSQLRAFNPDVVVHCLAMTPQHAQDCVEVFKGTNTHLIILGSMDCYEAFQQLKNAQEGSDFPIQESSPLSSTLYYWRGSNHSWAENYDKNLMTQVFLDAHAQGWVQPTVFRLPMVYGSHDYQYAYRHGSLIRRIYDQEKHLVLGATEQSRLWTYGYVENIAAGVVHAYSRSQTVGSTTE